MKGVVKSVVAGVEIEFNSEYLGKLFECPFEGYNIYFKGMVEVLVERGTDEVLEFIGGTTGDTLTNHNFLTPMGKMLLNLVRRGIVPRPQKRNEVNLLDVTLIYCLQNKFPIPHNIPPK